MVKINEGDIFSKRNSNTIAQELQSIKEHKEKGSVVQPLSASEEVGGITTEPKSVYKVKDLIHNTQENDKELLGIKGMTLFSRSNSSFRLKEEDENSIVDINKEEG